MRSENYNDTKRALPPLAIICGGLAVALGILTSVKADNLTTTLFISICGDGILQTSEEICDEGPGGNLGNYASSTGARTCAPGCASYGPYCGDGTLQVRFLEECDDADNEDGDLCSSVCLPLTPVPPGGGGAPPVGSTPNIPGATPGIILSQTETKVVVRGKAFPNRDVNIILDGQALGSVRADSNADFLFSTTAVTPGTATFGFWARDGSGTDSITTSVVFEVVQSAVTTVANVFLPPTIRVSERQIPPGELLTISGQSVPSARILTEIYGGAVTRLNSDADRAGAWALQVDTSSLTQGFHTAKATFELSSAVKSGFGRSVSFYIGDDSLLEDVSADLNGDGKVNLVDFSIFLLSWGSDNVRSDFNVDGSVNLADFSIMLFNWTG